MKLFFAKKFWVIVCCSCAVISYAQPGTTIDLENEKPEKYKEKLLKSEKTPEKKIGVLKRLSNNTVTHFNYYYNANLKLIDIYEKAKGSFVDDYTKLLPFYNYSLSTTAQDANIDSLIYKCNAGILLHDLRSDWVDDMYLLLGKAYLLRKNFDSAYYVFQYLNYIYAPKDDGYDVAIGSNENNESGIFTVSTDEKKRSFLNKVFVAPTKRNDALVWLARNYLEQHKTGEASGLLEILNNDPIFPKRLKTQLYEMNAYNYYQQKQYDSGAAYLLKSLDNAADRAERGRWEFLAAQMLQLSGNNEAAIPLYKKCIKHSTNPLIELQAYLNSIIGFTDTTKKATTKAGSIDIAALNKLAKKERYSPYKDIVYYAAGQASLQERDLDNAAMYFKKSATSSVDNPTQKSKSYLALANVEYMLKHYKPAYSYYDSVVLTNVSKDDVALVNARKPALKIIVDNIDAIALQDSVQLLAKLSPKELNDALKKIYKKYKKEKGLKDDEANSFDFGSDNDAVTSTTPSITFNTDAKPGEFYFDNESVKLSGAREFKSKWGNRPNVDNWNRAAVAGISKDEVEKLDKMAKDKQAKKAAAAGLRKANQSVDLSGDNTDNPFGMNPDDADDIKNSFSAKKEEKKEEKEITPESLYAAIPIGDDKLQQSNEIIINALYSNGETFSDVLEDYESAIAAYEELLRRFPNNKHSEQALFNLSYCYKKANKTAKELATKEKLDLNFKDGSLSKLLNDKTANSEKDQATRKYAHIYNMFIEGDYQNAKAEKNEADSLYKQRYWSPQLSFIESVYYIKQREDSIAIDKLNLIVKGNAEKPLKEKAALMIDILKRRKEIEEHLANLDSNGKYDSSLAARNAFVRDSLAKLPPKEEVYVIDSSLIGKPFIYNPNEPHYAVLLLEKVDDAFVSETKNTLLKYNNNNYSGKTPATKPVKLNKDYTLILLGALSNAPTGINYLDKLKPETPVILPWLPSFKYTYSLISLTNLEILRANNNMEKYKTFLKNIFPDKF